MPFNNAKTPLKPTGKARWQVPQRRKPVSRLKKDGTLSDGSYAMEYYLEGELRDRFIRLFPIHSNRRLMQWFGISFSTLQRFKIELGLQKDMRAIRRELASDVKRICESNGYYQSIRGKSPSEACTDAARRYIAEHGNPIRQLKKKNPRRYKRLMQQRSEHRKALIARERRRYNLTLQPLTDIPTHIIAGDPLTQYESHVRTYSKHFGYQPGSIDPDLGERHVIYYTAGTTRRVIFEANASRSGFTFLARKAAP